MPTLWVERSARCTAATRVPSTRGRAGSGISGRGGSARARSTMTMFWLRPGTSSLIRSAPGLWRGRRIGPGAVQERISPAARIGSWRRRHLSWARPATGQPSSPLAWTTPGSMPFVATSGRVGRSGARRSWPNSISVSADSSGRHGAAASQPSERTRVLKWAGRPQAELHMTFPGRCPDPRRRSPRQLFTPSRTAPAAADSDSAHAPPAAHPPWPPPRPPRPDCRACRSRPVLRRGRRAPGWSGR